MLPSRSFLLPKASKQLADCFAFFAVRGALGVVDGCDPLILQSRAIFSARCQDDFREELSNDRGPTRLQESIALDKSGAQKRKRCSYFLSGYAFKLFYTFSPGKLRDLVFFEDFEAAGPALGASEVVWCCKKTCMKTKTIHRFCIAFCPKMKSDANSMHHLECPTPDGHLFVPETYFCFEYWVMCMMFQSLTRMVTFSSLRIKVSWDQKTGFLGREAEKTRGLGQLLDE